MIDKVISELDFAIKLMTVPPKGNRGNPGEQYQSVDNELSKKDTKEISRLMRINHTGEICAQAL
jgi:ubiquinone biosynthesis monooxygenase Coq7